VGKTSLINGTGRLSYACSGEVSVSYHGRIGKGSGCLPWIDLPCFAEKALDRMIASTWRGGRCAYFLRQGNTRYHRLSYCPPACRRPGAMRPPEGVPLCGTVFLLNPWKKFMCRRSALANIRKKPNESAII